MDRSLRRAVLERLAAVEEMAVRTGSHLSVRATRTQLRSITGGWRELLLEHQPDLKGRCPVCSGWLRRRRWPCQVWVTAHEHLIGDGSEQTRSTTRKSTSFRLPRRVEVIPRQLEAPAAADHTGDAKHAGPEQNVAEQVVAGRTLMGSERHARQAPPEGIEIHRVPVTEHPPATMPRTRGRRSRA
ncbi:MAG: hypothetical protein ACRDSP_15245 [Pseudonocardiaceae bacterium]